MIKLKKKKIPDTYDVRTDTQVQKDKPRENRKLANQKTDEQRNRDNYLLKTETHSLV